MEETNNEDKNRNGKTGRFVKGNKAAVGNGRPKDSAEVKAAKLIEKITNKLDDRLAEMDSWIDEVAKTNPAKAFEMQAKFMDKILANKKFIEKKEDKTDGIKHITVTIKDSNNKEEGNDVD